MIFRSISVTLFSVAILASDGFLESISKAKVPFKGGDEDRGIFAKTNLEERRNFFHLFNVPYIVCFFAAKGKWPFIPSYMQVQVDQVGRSIFPQSDNFIRNYCQKWIKIKECFRPHHIIPVNPDPIPQTEPPVPAINTEVETIPVETTTLCMCGQRLREATPAPPVVFFDKNYVGNVSADTIYNTIEFLESFLPPPSRKLKRRNRIRDRN